MADIGPISEDHGPKGKPTLEELQALFTARTPGGTLSDPVWLSYFRVHCRQAKQYQQGRIFLAGDAAHISSNVGGQGMNTGLQDVFNLAWKLGLVLGQQASSKILDSYHIERHRAGKDMLELTDHLHRTALRQPRHQSLPDKLRQKLAGVLAGDEVMQRRMRQSVSELNISYRHSPIVSQHCAPITGALASSMQFLGWHDFGAGPQPGDRPPDAMVKSYPDRDSRWFSQYLKGTGHHLVLFAGAHANAETHRQLQGIAEAVTKAYGHQITCHLVVRQELPGDDKMICEMTLDPQARLHHLYGARHVCLYLLRPDGYVAFRSQPAELAPVMAYLERTLSLAR